VIENPDLIRIIVLSRGTLIGLKGLIAWGGHIKPISILGLIPEWKNAQKNLIKNKTSERIKKIILFLIVLVIFLLCSPSLLASMEVFFHHSEGIRMMIIMYSVFMYLFDSPVFVFTIFII